jgi:hypothetical protein
MLHRKRLIRTKNTIVYDDEDRMCRYYGGVQSFNFYNQMIDKIIAADGFNL